ncbi:MAG: hypothetical protein KKF78_09790, partial [Candidatus Omnitrophica bacterium]|nr:hypothetical protein [Candidatus Omnitrophota bacterium]MBU1997430.1 hypothetical protein [Candidatus Omnitrophota bacterium]
GIIILIGSVSQAETVRLITPYAGLLTNKIISTTTGSEIEDQAIMEGIFYQQIDPDIYQWNLFLYTSQDINQSDLYGANFIADRYFKKTDKGKFVIGMGMNGLDISSSPISVTNSVDISVDHTVYSPYARGGYYFYFNNDNGLNFSLMPWAGYETDIVRGEIKADIDPPGPAPVVSSITKIDHTYEYGLLGLQFKVDYNHFLNCQLKYHRKLSFDSKSGDLHNASAMINMNLSRKWGISYRHKYMEEITGTNNYHIFGVSYVF